ncbi:MAG: T9SS type A sorting domain-containing protein [Chitinivibrionales bacterium]|nr:T9SS type A sorting domain-containing protein [Chitinivibrionales bacterium]MBD3394211.1 T9SS type A sorting domain-containing protein [Chitinivibrionales bacterium]
MHERHRNHTMRMRPYAGGIAAALLCAWAVQSGGFQRFKNYGSVITANDIARRGDTVSVATTGGLYRMPADGSPGELAHDAFRFPDLKLTTLVVDEKGNLWAGSRQGYLYKIGAGGAHTTYTGYFSAGWEIRALYPYQRYLLVGSLNGFSIFDPGKGEADENATRLGDLKSPIVNALLVHDDTLYLGCEDGIATLNIAGNRLDGVNLLEREIWTTKETSRPVTGFVVTDGTVVPMSVPAAVYGTHILHADSTTLYLDSVEVAGLPSMVTRIRTDGDTCWIGTQDDYFYQWSLDDSLHQHRIRGLTFKSINRIFNDEWGRVWMFSKITPGKNLWWQGVGVHDGGESWRIYNSYFTEGIGTFGDNENFNGGAIQNNGDVWVGTPGGGVKAFDKDRNEWRRYYGGAHEGFGGWRLLEGDGWSDPWSKCDALCLDSAGYLWVSSWENPAGCLVCYDPRYRDPGNPPDTVATTYYRYFAKEPVQSQYYMENVVALNTDVNGTIFAGSESGQLLVFSHDGGEPLQGDITVHGFITNLVTVLDMVSTENGLTWIVTGKGLYRYDAKTDSLVEDEIVPQNLTAVEAESNDFVWLGTSGDGLIRYDWQSKSMLVRDQNHGLASNTIVDLSADPERGYLWVASDNGMSRYDLGHTAETITKNRGMEVYPNPFSFSDAAHAEVVIRKLAPQSSVHVYDARGTLVEKLSPASQNRHEWTFSWRPSRRLTPGTYFCAARTNSTSAVEKLLIIP